jgi:hypothetical protein
MLVTHGGEDAFYVCCLARDGYTEKAPLFSEPLKHCMLRRTTLVDSPALNAPHSRVRVPPQQPRQLCDQVYPTFPPLVRLPARASYEVVSLDARWYLPLKQPPMEGTDMTRPPGRRSIRASLPSASCYLLLSDSGSCV